jgi:hypothetical protein
VELRQQCILKSELPQQRATPLRNVTSLGFMLSLVEFEGVAAK